MIERFKERWNIKSNGQLLLILLVFSLTGSASLYVKQGVFFLLGINEDTALWLKVALYILTIIPTYYFLLIVIGFVFGQSEFALQFGKKMLSRFKFKKQ